LDYFLAVGLWFYSRKYFRDFPLWTDDECIAGRHLLSVIILHRAVGLRHFGIGVGQELKVQSFLCTKVFMRFGVVYADPEDNRTGVLVFSQIALKVLRFQGATAGKILWVKIENDPFALVIIQTNLPAVVGRERDRGRDRADLWCGLCHGERCCRQKNDSYYGGLHAKASLDSTPASSQTPSSKFQ